MKTNAYIKDDSYNLVAIPYTKLKNGLLHYCKYYCAGKNQITTKMISIAGNLSKRLAWQR